MTRYRLAEIGLDHNQRTLLVAVLELASGLEISQWQWSNCIASADALIIAMDSEPGQRCWEQLSARSQSPAPVVLMGQSVGNTQPDRVTAILSPPYHYPQLLTALKQLEKNLRERARTEQPFIFPTIDQAGEMRDVVLPTVIDSTLEIATTPPDTPLETRSAHPPVAITPPKLDPLPIASTNGAGLVSPQEVLMKPSSTQSTCPAVLVTDTQAAAPPSKQKDRLPLLTSPPPADMTQETTLSQPPKPAPSSKAPSKGRVIPFPPATNSARNNQAPEEVTPTSEQNDQAPEEATPTSEQNDRAAEEAVPTSEQAAQGTTAQDADAISSSSLTDTNHSTPPLPGTLQSGVEPPQASRTASRSKITTPPAASSTRPPHTDMAALLRPARMYYPATRLLGLIRSILAEGDSKAIDTEGHPPLQIFPISKTFIFPASLEAHADLFRIPAYEFSLTAIHKSASGDDPLTRPQPIEILLYTAALLGSDGKYCRYAPITHTLRLKQPPDFTRLPHTSAHQRLAQFMLNNNADLPTIAAATQIPIETVISFHNACCELHLIEHLDEQGQPEVERSCPYYRQDHPLPPQRSLFAKLRRTLRRKPPHDPDDASKS